MEKSTNFLIDMGGVPGFLSIGISIIAVPINFTSGAGIILCLFALILAGLSALSGNVLYALFTLSISTATILFVSVLFHVNESSITIALYLGIPYLVFGMCMIKGYRRRLVRYLE